MSPRTTHCGPAQLVRPAAFAARLRKSGNPPFGLNDLGERGTGFSGASPEGPIDLAQAPDAVAEYGGRSVLLLHAERRPASFAHQLQSVRQHNRIAPCLQARANRLPNSTWKHRGRKRTVTMGCEHETKKAMSHLTGEHYGTHVCRDPILCCCVQPLTKPTPP